jgi:glycosyltransferase involved in cell wall biosynthesis
VFLKVLFTIASLDARHGGPSRSVPALANALLEQGATVDLLAAEVDRNDQLSKRTRYGRLFHSSSFRKRLNNALPFAALVHDHGIWLPSNHSAAVMARQRRIPFVASPRGMLTPWALRSGRWHKRLAWHLYQRRDLSRAALLHATSEDEAREFRALNLKNPIAVIPNGIDLPPAAASVCGHLSVVGDRPTRTILFLSRIHPIKGLLNLVAAWAQLRSDFGLGSNWRVIIAGPNESGHQEEVAAAARVAGVRAAFQFIGPVSDEQKWDVYAQADLFVLPSYSENFGIVIGEALAAGVPVVTTRAAPWRIDTGPESLSAALREAMSLTREELQAMGQRGCDLIAQRYSWSGVAREMKSVYEWLLTEGERPSCVRVE